MASLNIGLLICLIDIGRLKETFFVGRVRVDQEGSDSVNACFLQMSCL